VGRLVPRLGDEGLGRPVLVQPGGVVDVDGRGLACQLVRRGHLERPDDLDLVPGAGDDPDDRLVGAGLESRHRDDADEPAVLDVGELRVDGGDVRAERAVGEHAARRTVDDRLDPLDPVRREGPPEHGQVALGDHVAHPRNGAIGPGQDAAAGGGRRVDLEGHHEVDLAIVERRDADDRLVGAVGEPRDGDRPLEAAGGGVRVPGVGGGEVGAARRQAVVQPFPPGAVDDRVHRANARRRQRPAGEGESPARDDREGGAGPATDDGDRPGVRGGQVRFPAHAPRRLEPSLVGDGRDGAGARRRRRSGGTRWTTTSCAQTRRQPAAFRRSA
jgi:hypothetical protein